MTSPSPLERLTGAGNVLAKEAPAAKEFDGLVRSGPARLKDAENDANSLESRFDRSAQVHCCGTKLGTCNLRRQT